MIAPVFFVVLAVLVLLSVLGILYVYISSKSKERLALIERGMDPNLARGDFWLQVGIIAAGAAAGLIVGDLLPGKYGPLVGIIFAGAGLVVYNIIRRFRSNKNGK